MEIKLLTLFRTEMLTKRALHMHLCISLPLVILFGIINVFNEHVASYLFLVPLITIFFLIFAPIYKVGLFGMSKYRYTKTVEITADEYEILKNKLIEERKKLQEQKKGMKK